MNRSFDPLRSNSFLVFRRQSPFKALPNCRKIFRVDSLPDRFRVGWIKRRFEPHDPKHFLRIEDDLARGGIERPTCTRVAESLRLRQICFAASQPVLRLLALLIQLPAFGNVDGRYLTTYSPRYSGITQYRMPNFACLHISPNCHQNRD